MKKNIIALILIACLSAFVNTKNDKVFKKLYALEGLWKMNGKRGAIYEEWAIINDDYLQNKGYIIKIDDTIVTERVALTNNRDGIFYTSTVEDQNEKKPVSFKMTSSESNQFIFENLRLDFPKRIVYRFISADSLHAFIDDGAGNTKRQHFYFKKQTHAIQPR